MRFMRASRQKTQPTIFNVTDAADLKRDEWEREKYEVGRRSDEWRGRRDDERINPQFIPAPSHFILFPLPHQLSSSPGFASLIRFSGDWRDSRPEG